jgi:hypothetical protein
VRFILLVEKTVARILVADGRKTGSLSLSLTHSH